MPETLTPDDVVAAAAVEAALRPVAGARLVGPQAAGPDDAWPGLLAANGRPIR